MLTEKCPAIPENPAHTEETTAVVADSPTCTENSTEAEPRTVRAQLGEAFSGLAPERIDRWYEAVFAKPDMAAVESEMDQTLQEFTETDLTYLAEAFSEGALPGIRAMERRFWGLFGISDAPEPMTISEWIAEDPQRAEELSEDDAGAMAFHYSVDDDGEFTGSWFLINPVQLDGQLLGMVLYSGAHEAWHARQAMHMSAAQKANLCQINLHDDPQAIPRAQLYLLNQAFYVAPDTEGYEAYAQQILENEAFLFGGKMLARIQELVKTIKNPALTAKLNQTIAIAG